MISNELLQQERLFESLYTQTQHYIMSVAQIRHFQPHDIFYQQDDMPVGFFLIQQGQVKLYRQSQARTQILALLGKGDTFGAEASCTQTRYSTYAEALCEGWAIFLVCDDIEKIIKVYPDFSLLLLHLISAELQQFTALVHSLAFRDVATRLARAILHQVELQQKTPQNNQVILERSLSQQDLAALVGTAREVIYRTLKKFQQEQLLQLTPVEIHILDFNRLQELAEIELA